MKRAAYYFGSFVLFWSIGVILSALEAPEASFWTWLWSGLGGMSLIALVILLLAGGIILFVMGVTHVDER